MYIHYIYIYIYGVHVADGSRTVKRTRSAAIDQTIPACVGEESVQLSPLTLHRDLEVRSL